MITKKPHSFPHNRVVVDVCSEDNGWIDMYLMSICRHNIIANSTFSWWASWLNENPDKVIIGPTIWYKNDGKHYAGPQIDSMIQIDSRGVPKKKSLY